MHLTKPTLNRKELKFTDIEVDQAKVLFPSVYSSKQVVSVLKKLISSCKLQGQLTTRIRRDEVFLYMNYGSDFLLYLQQIQQYIDERTEVTQQQQSNGSPPGRDYKNKSHHKITELSYISGQSDLQLTQEQLIAIASHQETGLSQNKIIENLQVLYKFGLTKEDIIALDGQPKNIGWLGSTAICIRALMSGSYQTQFSNQEIIYFLRQGKAGREQLLASYIPVSECRFSNETLHRAINNEELSTLTKRLMEEVLNETETNPHSPGEQIIFCPEQSVQHETPCSILQTSPARLPQKRPYIAIASKNAEMCNKKPKGMGFDNNETASDNLTIGRVPSPPSILFQPNNTITYPVADSESYPLHSEVQNGSYLYPSSNINSFFFPVVSSSNLFTQELEQINAADMP